MRPHVVPDYFFQSPNPPPRRDIPAVLRPPNFCLRMQRWRYPRTGVLCMISARPEVASGLAQAGTHDTRVQIGAWQLTRAADDHYRTQIRSKDFDLALLFTERFRRTGAPGKSWRFCEGYQPRASKLLLQPPTTPGQW